MKKILLATSVLFFSIGSVFASGTPSHLPTPEKPENPGPVAPVTNTDKPIKGLIVLNDFYAMDDDFVYVVSDKRDSWIKIPNADRVTFHVVGGQFAADRDQVFLMGKVIIGADLKSFSVISAEHGYAQDDKHVYGPHGVMVGADPETFTMLTRYYSMDAGHVFYTGKLLDGADAGTFQVIDHGLYATDSEHVYYAGELLKGVSPVGLEVKGSRAFAADGRTFFEGMIEKGDLPHDDGKDYTPEQHEDAYAAFWNALRPYTSEITAGHVTFWIVVILGVLGIFSLVFLFFAERSEVAVSLLGVFLKTLASVGVGIFASWVASFFALPQTALWIGIIVGIIFFIVLTSVIGLVRALLITLLTIIGFSIVFGIIILLFRGYFDGLVATLTFFHQPMTSLMVLMGLIGFFFGTWLIKTQLRIGLFHSIGLAAAATVVSLVLLGFFYWIVSFGTIISSVVFSVVYAILLWIMRFRSVSSLFVESVRIVRVALLLLITIIVVAWIVL